MAESNYKPSLAFEIDCEIDGLLDAARIHLEIAREEAAGIGLTEHQTDVSKNEIAEVMNAQERILVSCNAALEVLARADVDRDRLRKITANAAGGESHG